MRKGTIKAKRLVIFTSLFLLFAVSPASAQRENAQTGLYERMTPAGQSGVLADRGFGTAGLSPDIEGNHKDGLRCIVAKESHSGTKAQYRTLWPKRSRSGNLGKSRSVIGAKQRSHSSTFSA